ncbi:MAG: cell division protein CrgA [Acidimicrobiales bacterium]|nr:cell division protein CrgA [Acidimicrobiales bacterium]
MADAKKTPSKRRVQGGRVTPKGGTPRDEVAEPAPAPKERFVGAVRRKKAMGSEAGAESGGEGSVGAEVRGKDAGKSGKDSGGARARAKPKSANRTTTSGRYTPPADRSNDMPSPTWVPVLMFTFWILGMLVIFLNYVSLLPGAVSNWYLLVGLGLILAGIITATQYR